MASEKDLTILLKVKDEASKALDNFNTHTGALTSTIKAAGVALLAMGVAAATATVAFGIESVKAAAEAEAKMAIFNTTLKNSVGVTEEVRNKMLEASRATIQLGFDDEDAAVSISKLYQRTGDLSSALNLNSIAMDLAKNKNLDLTTASNLVGLVLSGNGRVLKQYGVDLKESATPMEAVIELQGKLKGSAEAFSKTYTGQLGVMKVNFDNLKETIGDKLLPVLNEFMQKMIPVIIKLMDMASKVGSLTDIYKSLQNQITSLLNYIDSKSGIITILKNSWNDVATVFKTSLLPQLKILYDQLQPLMPSIKIFAEIVGVILYGAFIATVKILELFIVSLTKGLTGAMLIVNVAIKEFKGFWEGLTTTLSKVIDYVDRLISKIQSLNILSKVSSTIGNIGSSLGFGGGKAVGGPVSGGTAYLVGEQGPEMFVPTGNGSIIPNNRMGGSSITINISGNTLLDSRAAEKIGNMITDKLGLTTKYAY